MIQKVDPVVYAIDRLMEAHAYPFEERVAARKAMHDLFNAKDERIAELERECSAQRKCADAYFNALVDVRKALGLSEHDEHEFVTDSIKRLVSRLCAVEAERDEYRAQAISLFWGGDIGDKTAGEIREAAKKVWAAFAEESVVEGQEPCSHVWEQTSADTGFCKLCRTPWEIDVEGLLPALDAQSRALNDLLDNVKLAANPAMIVETPLPEQCKAFSSGHGASYYRYRERCQHAVGHDGAHSWEIVSEVNGP